MNFYLALCTHLLILQSFSDIVRILFLVPVYANISFASYLFWVRHNVTGDYHFSYISLEPFYPFALDSGCLRVNCLNSIFLSAFDVSLA